MEKALRNHCLGAEVDKFKLDSWGSYFRMESN